jgi:hypothetical protein
MCTHREMHLRKKRKTVHGHIFAILHIPYGTPETYHSVSATNQRKPIQAEMLFFVRKLR